MAMCPLCLDDIGELEQMESEEVNAIRDFHFEINHPNIKFIDGEYVEDGVIMPWFWCDYCEGYVLSVHNHIEEF